MIGIPIGTQMPLHHHASDSDGGALNYYSFSPLDVNLTQPKYDFGPFFDFERGDEPGNSYETTCKQIKIPMTGIVRVRWDFADADGVSGAWTQLLKNGSIVAGEFFTYSITPIVEVVDVNCQAGDTLSVQVRGTTAFNNFLKLFGFSIIPQILV